MVMDEMTSVLLVYDVYFLDLIEEHEDVIGD